MDIALPIAALALAATSLALVFPLRALGARAQEAAARAARAADEARAQAASLETRLAETRQQLDHALRDLAELRSSLEMAPPPLPKAQPRGLNDLREQLRAAMREASDEETTE